MSDDDRFRSLFQGGPEGDLRFQFEIIKGLGESVRAQTEVIRSIQDQMRVSNERQYEMSERLTRIESNKVSEEVADLRARHDALNGRVDGLERDKDIRDGGSLMRRALVTWWPVIVATFTALWFLGRASGIIHMPSDEQKAPIVVPYETVHRETSNDDR